MAKHQFRVIDTYACPKLVAPYIYIVLRDAKAEVESIYRGDDARALLNKYGHHTQYQLVHATPAQRAEWGIIGTPDPVDESTHELKSDARAFPKFPLHAELDWWMQGWDVNGGAQADACERAAAKHEWEVFRPYSSGAEVHHCCFKVEPKPHTVAMRARIIKVRATLPRS